MTRIRLVDGGERAAGTVYALGRNYAAHAREMAVPPLPVVFIKPASALLAGGGTVPWPDGSREVHHEVELVLLLGAGGTRLGLDEARRAISGLAVGVDLTARDLQSEAKRGGGPWARSKGFPGSAPLSPFVAPDALEGGLGAIDVRLEVAGRVRQEARVSEMLLAPDEIVALLSRWFALRDGDLVFTGTPEGVGTLAPGEPVLAESRALGVSVSFAMGPRPGP